LLVAATDGMRVQVPPVRNSTVLDDGLTEHTSAGETVTSNTVPSPLVVQVGGEAAAGDRGGGRVGDRHCPVLRADEVTLPVSGVTYDEPPPFTPSMPPPLYAPEPALEPLAVGTYAPSTQPEVSGGS